jgi:hypothetical protein
VTVRKTVYSELHFAGCDTIEVVWRLSSKIRERIRYGHRLTITFRYRDSNGLMSRPVSRRWDILD